MYECQEVSNTALHNFPWPQTLKKKLEMRTRIKEKSLTPVGFEPKSSGLDHRRSTNWATRSSWEKVSIRWLMSGQTLNCVWWCNRRGVWCVESGSSCHRRNEGRENNGGVNVPGAFLVFIGLLWYFWWFPLMDLDQTFTSELLESFPRVLSVVMKTTFCQHRTTE